MGASGLNLLRISKHLVVGDQIAPPEGVGSEGDLFHEIAHVDQNLVNLHLLFLHVLDNIKNAPVMRQTRVVGKTTKSSKREKIPHLV